jgi:peroxiredoxin
VDLRDNYEEFRARQTEVLALAVHDLIRAELVTQATQAPFPILADPDHAVAEAYSIYNLLGDGLATPAVFVINTSGEIVWSYVGQNAGDRPGVETILENLPTD